MRKFLSLVGLLLYCHVCLAQMTDLQSFTVKQTVTGNVIKWQTSKDCSYSKFKIEVSRGGQIFTPVTVIENNSIGEYQFEYNKKYFGIVYFRIGILNESDFYKPLKTISIVNTPSLTEVIQGVVYSKGLIEVYNLSGQLLASDNETLNLSSIKGGQMVLIKTNTVIKYFIQ